MAGEVGRSILTIRFRHFAEIAMSPLQSILLHVDASPCCVERLQLAQRLAEPYRASVTAMYAETPASVQYPYTFNVGPEVFAVMQNYEAERRQKAKAAFERSPLSTQAVSQWLEAHGDPIQAFVHQSWTADLMVLGQHEVDGDHRPDLPANWVESVLVHSGKPALVVPYVGVERLPGQTVLVAWKDSRESARALAASMPFLQRAKQVHVATWQNDSDQDPREPASSVQLERYLARHGVSAQFHRHGRNTPRVGELVLSLAAETDSDLIVMGAYGHSRAREWVLGGVTRTLLDSMTVPLLMCH